MHTVNTMCVNKIETDNLEKTVTFLDADGNLVLSATLGIKTGNGFPERMLDMVNQLIWDFPGLVEERIIAVGE